MPHNELTNIKTDGQLGGKARGLNSQITNMDVSPIGQVKVCIILLAEAMRRLAVHRALQGKAMTNRDHRMMEVAMWHDFKRAMRMALGMPTPATEGDEDALRGAAAIMEHGELPAAPVVIAAEDQ